MTTSLNEQLFEIMYNSTLTETCKWQQLESLLQQGADVNAPSHTYTHGSLLIWACIKGYQLIAKKLVTDWQANMEITDRNGNSALHWAYSEGYRELVDFLIDMGARESVNHNGLTPAQYAQSRNGQAVISTSPPQNSLAQMDQEINSSCKLSPI